MAKMVTCFCATEVCCVVRGLKVQSDLPKCVPALPYSWQVWVSGHEIIIIQQVDSIINKLLVVWIQAWLLFLFTRISLKASPYVAMYAHRL